MLGLSLIVVMAQGSGRTGALIAHILRLGSFSEAWCLPREMEVKVIVEIAQALPRSTNYPQLRDEGLWLVPSLAWFSLT